jgi:hypothetical protein
MPQTYYRTYKSAKFVDKIEFNLAQVSASENDEFQLVNSFYDPHGFDCELCGHKHCNYALIVKDIQTKKELRVGSECIQHFKDRGVDIDVAEGLIKRVMKATAEARRELKDELAEKAWDAMPEAERAKIKSWEKYRVMEELGKNAMKALSKHEKAELTVQAFMVVQAKELLLEVARNHATLTEEQIAHIVELGLKDKMDDAQRRAVRAKAIADANMVQTKMSEEIRKAKETGFVLLDQKVIDDLSNQWVANYDPAYATSGYNPVKSLYQTYLNERDAIIRQYPEVVNYQGKNAAALDIKNFLIQRGYVTYAQQNLVKNIVQRENTPIDTEFETALAYLKANLVSSFVESIGSFYTQKGYVTPAQRGAIIKLYERVIVK